ncbi:MAG: glycosyltransferase [Candidatus Omnitrophica bacterium]|jgi:spore maturation protein CgeB|nr:glycosyltransferase [Candidatus Omnitrophota bacterium]
MRLALIFNKDREDTIGRYFENAAKALGIEYGHFWTSDPNIPAGYDLYLRIDHGDYKYDIPAHLKPCAFYAIDTHLEKPYRKIRAQAAHYDRVFCAQKNGAQKLKHDTGISAVWVPIACDPGTHKDLGVERKLDIAFVGTEGKKNPRGEMLKQLARRYPNSFIGRAESSLMSNIYSSAKIGFNYSINNDINMRMFEVLSCGALLMTNRIKDNGFEELFADGENVVVYNDKDDLFRKADYFLNNREQGRKIASAGHILAVSEYTYGKRLERMLEESGWK